MTMRVKGMDHEGAKDMDHEGAKDMDHEGAKDMDHEGAKDHEITKHEDAKGVLASEAAWAEVPSSASRFALSRPFVFSWSNVSRPFACS